MYFMLVLLIILFINISVEYNPNCCHENSYKVHKLLLKFVNPEIKRNGIKLPNNCPLNYELDQFLDSRKLIHELANGRFKCVNDSKEFINYHYAELHTERMHKDLINPKSICLSDYCHLLHCDEGKQIKGLCLKRNNTKFYTDCENMISNCIDKEYTSLRYKLKAIICDPFLCKTDVKFVLENKEYTPFAIFKIIVGITFVFVASIFYFIYMLNKSDKRIIDDIKGLGSRRSKIVTDFIKNSSKSNKID